MTLVIGLKSSVGASHFVTRMPEWGLSGILLGMAAQLLRGVDSFSSTPAYQQLSRNVSQTTWGTFALVIATFWLVGLTINGVVPMSRRWTPWVRSLCGCGAAIWWITNGLFYLLFASEAPGLVNNFGHGFLALASSIIVAREVGEADQRAKACRPSQQKTG